MASSSPRRPIPLRIKAMRRLPDGSLSRSGLSAWRCRCTPGGAEGDSMVSGQVDRGHLESEILPTGNLGWSVRPRRNLVSLWRLGVVAVMLLAITFPAIVDPARSMWAIGLDSFVLIGIGVLFGLFFRNDRVF